MKNYDYDLFVIGAGSGGVRAARMAAQLGKRVAVAEESKPGGTCVVRGCVPKKYLVYGAEFGTALQASQKYGWSFENAHFQWSDLRDSIQKEVNRLSGIYSDILERNGAKLFSEQATLIDTHTIRLTQSGNEITAQNILIAVGGRPWLPDIKGIEYAISSDEAFLLHSLPDRALIIGGGYIASEFAGIFAGLGVKTVQAYRGPALLNGFDDDVRRMAGTHQEMLGIDVRYNLLPKKISKNRKGYKVDFVSGTSLETDLVFMATGRKPYTKALGLEQAGINTDKNEAIVVDEYSRTSVKHIYAVGDVTNRVNLTPVAIREAMAFVQTLYGDKPVAYDHNNIASAVFTIPPIGVVGLTETQARQVHGDNISVYTTSFRPMKNIIAEKKQKCFMKLITCGEKETVIGIHLVGDDSPEIIQALGICIKAGLTKADFDRTCAVHPTIAEEIVTLKN